MKYLMIFLIPTLSFGSTTLCEVKVCNKLERFTLNITKKLMDSMGEQCFTLTLPKEEAQVGKVLSSDSRWYQGSSFNPTKKSVTRIKRLLKCDEDKR